VRWWPMPATACAGAGPVWRLVEEQADGKPKFAFSDLPAGTSCIAAVRLWKSRWPVGRGYQQLREELGVDHFEGRGRRGFHHHAATTVLAYGFLLLERHRAEQDRKGRAKGGRRAGADAARHSAGDAATADAPRQARLCLLPLAGLTPSSRVTE
jgi:hypothetical protein